jgi:Tfp pilus assembly protein PilF
MMALVQMAQGNEAKAIVELEQAIDISPSRSAPYNALAGIYAKSGNPEKVEQTYLRLLENNPGDPLTCNNLANVYLEQGRSAEALDLARRALVGAPNDPNIQDTFGWILESAGEHDKAASFLEAAAKALPKNQEVLLHWGINLRARKQDAADVLAQVIRIAPDSPVGIRAASLLKE